MPQVHGQAADAVAERYLRLSLIYSGRAPLQLSRGYLITAVALLLVGAPCIAAAVVLPTPPRQSASAQTQNQTSAGQPAQSAPAAQPRSSSPQTAGQTQTTPPAPPTGEPPVLPPGATPEQTAPEQTSPGNAPVPSQRGPELPMSQTRIRVPVTYVDIPVLALDRAGSPIGGLSRDIFRVQDDGRPQRIAAFDGEPRPIALAIVVDTFQPEAVAQAQRAAEVIANMVVGDSGVAALFIGGPEPREILPFTGDRNRLVDALKHLELNAHGPDITAPLQLAISRVRQQPREDTRAVLVISRQSSRGGHFAGAIVEMSMNDAIPVFRISPNRPKQPLPQNPVSTDNNGPGPGSSRQQPHVPTGAEQPIPPPQGGTAANIDPGVILSKIGGALARGIDYVHATGGLTLKPSNDGDFDRELSKVGDALRYVYHVFYRPDDLTPDPQLHSVTVQVNRAGIKQLAYRHTYVAVLVQ